ncbi:MAG: FAD-binding oxidoreductase [Gemmatimonadaceae bacterium]
MSGFPEQTQTAWGRSSVAKSRVWTPASTGDVCDAIAAARSRGVIARGFGRSYGDACLNDQGDVVNTTSLNSIRSFDESTGVIDCDSGVSFADIMRHCLPKGWMPPVCPGTAIVSMGGAIANDVHGKNQHIAGTFGDHVEWFDLLTSDGAVTRVSRESDDELFEATLGGIGLTGIVLRTQFQLQRVPSNAFEITESRVPNLDAFLERLSDQSSASEYMVGWIDGLTSGRNMGRGILEAAKPTASGVSDARGMRLTMPLEVPQWVLNRYSVGLFNAAYFHRIPTAGRTRRIHVNAFLYPLDALLEWNRLYGTRGVYQFQCVVPFETARRACIELMEETIKSQSASFLAVIKAMTKPGAGLLSWATPGISLALDFPRRGSTLALMHRLHEITLRHGGRVYLAKDACLTAEQFAQMYPKAARFKAVLQRVDPNARLQSDMARRLGLR